MQYTKLILTLSFLASSFVQAGQQPSLADNIQTSMLSGFQTTISAGALNTEAGIPTFEVSDQGFLNTLEVSLNQLKVDSITTDCIMTTIKADYKTYLSAAVNEGQAFRNVNTVYLLEKKNSNSRVDASTYGQILDYYADRLIDAGTQMTNAKAKVRNLSEALTTHCSK